MPKYGHARHFCTSKLHIMQFTVTNQIKLVLFKKLSYGEKMACMPIFGHTLFGTKFFMGIQETIIYRLVVRNPNYDTYFSFLMFLATFGMKMGKATTHTLYGLGLPNPTKNLAHQVDLLSQPLSRNHDFEIFRGKPPPLTLRNAHHVLFLGTTHIGGTILINIKPFQKINLAQIQLLDYSKLMIIMQYICCIQRFCSTIINSQFYLSKSYTQKEWGPTVLKCVPGSNCQNTPTL